MWKDRIGAEEISVDAWKCMHGLLHVQTTQHCQQCAEDREDAIGMVLAYSCQFLMGKEINKNVKITEEYNYYHTPLSYGKE